MKIKTDYRNRPPEVNKKKTSDFDLTDIKLLNSSFGILYFTLNIRMCSYYNFIQRLWLIICKDFPDKLLDFAKTQNQ